MSLLPSIRNRISNLFHTFRHRRAQVTEFFARLAAAADPTRSAQRARTRWWDPFLIAALRYLESRPRQDLSLGIPALTALIVLLTITLVVSGTRPFATRYTELLQSAQNAMASHDYAKALIAYERMVQVGHNDPGTVFSLAQCLSAMGEYQRAAQLLYQLAPDDSLGYIPAHRTRAFLIYQQPNATADDLALARSHLQRVLAVRPDDDEAHGLLASIMLRQKDIESARNQFAQGVDSRPDLALNAALLSRNIGDDAAVERHAAIAVLYFQDRLKTAKEPVLQDILLLAQSLSLQKKYAAAIAAIETYLDQSDGAGRDRLVKAIMDICAVWQNQLDLRHGADDLDRLQIAQTVLKYDPQNHTWQIHLLNLTSDASVVRTTAIHLLGQLADGHNAGPEACFFLGMEAYNRKDFPAARTMLERSYAQKSDHPATANNLACAYLENPDSDLGLALKFADQALAAAPGNPIFQETRGEVFIALGRWSDAAADLESALPHLSDRRRAHKNLAIAYENLHQPDKAREHQNLSLEDHP